MNKIYWVVLSPKGALYKGYKGTSPKLYLSEHAAISAARRSHGNAFKAIPILLYDATTIRSAIDAT